MAATSLKVAAILSNFITSLILAAEISDFMSIDCGGVVDSVDQESGIPYKSDKNMINSGVPSQISAELRESFDLRYRTLRSFPEEVKNCYSVLKPASGRGNNYLVRAIFLYGNYDGKNSTPVYQIYLGVDLWDTIMDDDTRTDAVYMAPTDTIDVCLVNIGRGVPYISLLEIRQLDNSIYRTQPHLFPVLWYRYDVGIDNSANNPRYPLDVEDRIWIPYEETGWDFLRKMQTNESMINKDKSPYKLPESMLKTAYGTQNSSIPFVYTWTPDYGASSIFYFCFHFAEIEKLDSAVREMRIVLNDIHTIAQSVKLQYLKPQTICSTSAGLPVNFNQENYLQIFAASDSNLPPIINGFEVYYLREFSNSPTLLPTLLQDVNAIRDILKKFKVLLNIGDPCLPQISGLNCSQTNPPRIISLNFSRSKLTGEIPYSISNLTQLETLDLSYNDLTGSIPEYLAHFPLLKILNLAGNNLSGLVPEALVVKSRDGVLDLSVTDNPELCWSPSCKKKKHSVVPIVVAIGAAVVLLICFALLLIHLRNKKKSWKEKVILKPKNWEYSYSEVVRITENFKHIIGEGGFGKVYKGTLKDKTMVAVKLLSATSKQGDKEFQAEAQLLMIFHHRNLVSLVGYCNMGHTKALIYEYMVNGNLHQHLFETGTNVLSWNERLKIAVDAAHGLEYLHNGCKPPIVHRDLKPSNILLDEMMQAKIADFGLSRTFPNDSQSPITTQLAGTPGYLDPESRTRGNLNKKSDMFIV